MRVALPLCSLLLFGVGLPGQQEEPLDRLRSYLRQNQKELVITDGRIAGPGGDWLRSETAQARFTFVGEEHDVAEVPRFLRALWHDLADAGYRHVALEAGPWLGNRLDRYARFDDRAALASFYAATQPRRPNISVPPASVDDERFIEALGRSRLGRLSVVWGLDQEFKRTPLLRRLRELSRDRGLREIVDPLLKRVEPAEGGGRYDCNEFRNEIERLAAHLSRNRNSEIEALVEGLRRCLAPGRPMKGMPSGARQCSPREVVWLRPFVEAAAGNWTLFDLRPLRREISHGGLDVPWQTAETIFGWDAVLLSKKATPVAFPPVQ